MVETFTGDGENPVLYLILKRQDVRCLVKRRNLATTASVTLAKGERRQGIWVPSRRESIVTYGREWASMPGGFLIMASEEMPVHI